MPLTTQPLAVATRADDCEVLRGSITSATSAKRLAKATARRFLTIYNDSASSLCVDFGSTVTLANFAVRIPPYGFYECPLSAGLEVRGIWAAADGKALVREFL